LSSASVRVGIRERSSGDHPDNGGGRQKCTPIALSRPVGERFVSA